MQTYKLKKDELRSLIEEEALFVETTSLVASLAADDILLEKVYPNLGKEFVKNDRVAFFVAGDPPEWAYGVVKTIHDRARDGLDIMDDEGTVFDGVRPRYIWIEGEEPDIDDVAAQIDADAGIDTGSPEDYGLDRTPLEKEESTASMIIMGLLAWVESTDAVTALKEEIAEIVLEQFGVEPTDVIGLIVSNTFANLKITQLENYFGDDVATGSRQLAKLLVKSISGVVADVGLAMPLQELMGLQPGKGKADVILTYIKASLISDFEETPLGKKLIDELTDKIYEIRSDVNGWLESKLLAEETIVWIQNYVKENMGFRPPARVVKKAIKTGVFDFGDAASFFFQSIAEKAKKWAKGKAREIGVDLEESTNHKLTSIELRQIIKEEIQLLSKRPQEDVIQEGWFLIALGATILGAISTVLTTAVVVSSPITHKVLDWAAEWIEEEWPVAAKYIKTRISDSILEGIGYNGDQNSIVYLVIPPIIANTKLHRLDDYLDLEGDRREFASVIVGAMNQALVRSLVVEKLLVGGLGLNKNSWIGSRLATIVEVWISEFANDQDYADMLIDELTDLMSPEELKGAVEAAMEESAKDKGMFDRLVDEAGKFALGL